MIRNYMKIQILNNKLGKIQKINHQYITVQPSLFSYKTIQNVIKKNNKDVVKEVTVEEVHSNNSIKLFKVKIGLEEIKYLNVAHKTICDIIRLKNHDQY